MTPESWVRTLAAAVLGVAEESLSVTIAPRTSDKTGLAELACEVRLNGEILTGEQEARVQEVLTAAVEAANVMNEARKQGVPVTPRRNNR